MSPCLIDLPASILLTCFEYVDNLDICNLSLTNKSLQDLAAVFRFRVIKLHATSRITQDCPSVRSEILASGKVSYVRHLQLLPTEVHNLLDKLDYQNAGIEGARPLEPYKYSAAAGQEEEISLDQWQCLVDFMQEMPALKDVTWACPQQIPSLVLRQIQRQGCRLHMRNFALRSLVVHRGQPPRISTEDLELVTSPCLHSLVYLNYGTGLSNFIDDAVLEMVSSGAAPNLTEIWGSWGQQGGNIGFEHALRTPALPWQPGIISQAMPRPESRLGPRSYLKSLALLHAGSCVELRRWYDNTDFKRLTKLKVYQYLNEAELDWLASCHLNSLTELAIAGPSQCVSSFILTTPSLHYLEISSHIEHIALAKVLRHCGPSLKSLYCREFATQDLLELLQEHCSQLVELGLNVYRQTGSAEEIHTYHSFGRLRKLRKLCLSIHSPQPIKDLGDDSSLEELIATIKNLAFDATLARSIFEIISRAKTEFSAPLQRLELRMDALTRMYRLSDLKTLLGYTSRSWTCTSSPSAQGRFGCTVKPMHRTSMQAFEQSDDVSIFELLDGPLAPAILAVWPECHHTPLRDAWHSFPLQGY